MKDAASALEVLNTYYRETGRDITESILENWVITPHLEAFVLISVQGSQNIAYMIKDQTVVMYSPNYRTNNQIYEAHFI